MVSSAKDFGLVETDASSLPVLAVNVLDRLGYTVKRASKQLDQILASERLDEQIGRDWWHHDYRVVVRWQPASEGVIVHVDVTEKKGGGTDYDCQDRCDQILLQLQDDAARASKVSRTKEKSTIYGAARWGTVRELAEVGYLTSKPDPKRLIIGKSDETGQYISVPELVTNAHSIVCGRTGVGKTRGFFIPNLIERIGTNMIVTEATPGFEQGEVYSLTSGWRKLAGHQIFSFNPADMSSTRINPVDRVRLAPEHEKAKEAEKLADLIILNGQREEARIDPTWDRSEKQLLTSLILHTAETDPKYGHIGAIRWLLLSGINSVRKVLDRSPSDLAQMEFEGWLQATSENFRFGVLSGLMTKLNPWITDQLVTLTETTDIDLEQLRSQLFTFYIAVPSRSGDSKLIGSLMLNFLLDYLLDSREQMKYPTALFLDEFTNFGRIANIADVLSIIRKAGMSLVLGFQNYHQLERVYSRKEAQIIFDQPATQIYFRQKNFQEARALSEALGRTTIEDVVVTDGGRVQELIQARALATPDELINLKQEVIAFTNDTYPLKLQISPPDAYHHALEYPSPERPIHEVSDLTRKRGRENKKSPRDSKSKKRKSSNSSSKENRDRYQNETRKQPGDRSQSQTRRQPRDRPEVDDIWQA